MEFSHSPGDSGAWGACLLGSGEGISDSITRSEGGCVCKKGHMRRL